MDKKFFIAVLAGAAAFFTSCDRNNSEPETPETQFEAKSGFYILNEGAYNAENASLDFYDSATDEYLTNVFGSQNRGLALGDVANDILIHEDLLLIAVNGTGLVRILDAATAKQIATVEVPDCRYMTIVEDWLYVTSYADNGTLYKISLEDRSIAATLQTGYEPEQLFYRDGHIYVLNSGGYHGYSDTITVVDAQNFKVSGTIDIGYQNLYKTITSGDNVYITSRGNYGDDPGAVFTLDRNNEVTLIASQPVSNWCCYNGTIYTQSTIYDSSWNAVNSFGTISGGQFSSGNNYLDRRVTSSISSPYCLEVNPDSGEFIVTDANDYASTGSIYYFNSDGSLAWSHAAGVCPAKIAWVL